MPDGVTNAQAAHLLGVTPSTIGRQSHTFRLVNEKSDQGRVFWREDVILKAVEIKAMGQKLSVEKLIERAIREVEG